MSFGTIGSGTLKMFNANTGEEVFIGNVKNIKMEEVSMEEKLNKYLEENSIEVDKNGNFEMFVVVDADDKDHEVGSIFHGTETEVYSENRAYEDLKVNNNGGMFYGSFYHTHTISLDLSSSYLSDTKIEKKSTIRESLMKLEDSIFKVLVNKDNVTKVDRNVVYVNKYKVLEEIVLHPILKYKIKSIDSDKVTVLLYNSLTEKSKTIECECFNDVDSLVDIKELINEYLGKNEKQIALINSIVDDGAEL